MGVSSFLYFDFSEGKRWKLASCHKTEPADDTEEGTLKNASV